MKDYIAEMATDDLSKASFNPSWAGHTRDLSSITKIIVHHEAQLEGLAYDDDARYEAEANYQNNISIPGSKGLQYHFKIDNAGLINQTRDLSDILWHCGNLDVNIHSLAICLDGNFEEQAPTREQYEALKQLLDNLCTQHPEFPAVQMDVYGHREESSTACPGANLFPFVVDYRQNAGNVSIPDVPYQHPELQPDVAVAAPAPVPETPAPVVSNPVPVVEPVPAPSAPPVVAPAPTPPASSSDATSSSLTPPVNQPHNVGMRNIIVQKLVSRKLWLAVAAVITFVINGQIDQALIVVLGYLGAQGFVDAAASKQ